MRFNAYIPILLLFSTIVFTQKINDIRIIGNEKTKDYIILREIEHPIPSIFNPKTAQEDENRIYNLNLFSKVNIDTIDNTYIVDVSENFYIFPIPIIDYNEIAGTTYGAALLNINFRGHHETILAGFLKGDTDEYFLFYNNPWIYGDHISLGVEIEKLSYNHHAYNNIIYNINASQIFTGCYIGPNHKFKFITGYSSHELIDNINSAYKYYDVKLRYKYDTRDIYIDPTKGLLMNFKINNYYGVSDIQNIHQLEFIGNYYKSLKSSFPNPVLHYRCNIYLQASNDNIPLFHKKYLGSYKLVKGYSSVPDQNGDYSHKIEVDNFIYNSITLQNTVIPRHISFSLLGKEIEVGTDFRLFVDYGIGAKQRKLFDTNDSILGYGIGTTFFISGGEINIDLAFNQSGEFRIHFYGSE